MDEINSRQLINQITLGIELAIKKMIDKSKKENGEIVISKGNSVVKVKASDIVMKES
jgi:hypothetical protein